MSALIWCPFPDHETAATAADALLDEGLVACANILGGMESHFIWKGERGVSQEVGVLFKTHSDNLDVVVKRIESLHPYETPAILGWKCSTANAATEAWLAQIAAGERGT